MAQSLPQSKPPEAGGGALRLRASASHVDKLDWAADPRGPFRSTWETSVAGGPPALPVLTPSLWGGRHFSALMSTSILQSSAQVSVCPGSSPIRWSAASPIPTLQRECVCCHVCLPRNTGPPTSLSLARPVGWHSLCSVWACGTGFKVGGPNAISS